MKVLKGHFDGIHIIISDSMQLAKGQEVTILVDESDKSQKRAAELVGRYYGICQGMLNGRDAQECVNELRANDRV